MSVPGAASTLGRLMMKAGDWTRVAALVEQLRNDHPGDPEVESLVQDILSYPVPAWHGRMLADAERNDAYERAISRAVSGGQTLLDIGTGSGLLAMIAARAGASVVYGCEANGALAATAQEIAIQNGFTDTIHILNKHSTELDRDGDLQGGVDVIVAEVFGSSLLSEGALRTFRHAAGNLLRAGGQIIPAKAVIRVALAHYDFEQTGLVNVQGFDLSRFGRHLKPTRWVPVGSPRLQLRSEPANLFSFDLQSGCEFQSERVALKLSCRGGAANGVVRWIQLTLDGEETYENIPEQGRKAHWDAGFTALPHEVAHQTDVLLGAVHDMEHVCIWSS